MYLFDFINENITDYIDTSEVRFPMKQLKYFQDLYAYCMDVMYFNIFMHCCIGILNKRKC